MTLDKQDKKEFLARFDAKMAEARKKYDEYLSGEVKMGDYFNVTFSFALNWGESSALTYKGNS